MAESAEEKSVPLAEAKAGVKLQAGHRVVLVIEGLHGLPIPGARSGTPEPEPAPEDEPGKGKPAPGHKPAPEHHHAPEHKPAPEHHQAPEHKPAPAHHAPEHKPVPEPKPPPKKKPPHEKPPHHNPPAQTGGVREKVVANAHWGIAHEPYIHYKQVRPIAALHHPHELPLTTDCSGFATLCYKWSGAPDPNGNGYDGQGYTGTMLQHMRHIPQAQVEPGDLVVFGAAPGHHVCIALNKGGHQLASHGQERGPAQISFGDEHAYQTSVGAGQVTWLSLIKG